MHLDPLTLLYLYNALITLAGLIGGFFAFRKGHSGQLIQIKDETITAMQQQINAIKAQLELLQRENERQGLVIQTIQVALKKRGIFITIDGDMVTISDASGSYSFIQPTTSEPANKKETLL
jgi:transposase